MNIKKLKSNRRILKEKNEDIKINIFKFRTYIQENKYILKENLELEKLKFKSKILKIKLEKIKYMPEEIIIPVDMLKLSEVIAESTYDYEVPYLFVMGHKNIVEDVIPLTHPQILMKRDKEHIELNLHNFRNKRFILCHTHPNGFIELSREECNLKNHLNLAVHVIYPLQKSHQTRQKYQYIDKTTVTWQSQYFSHILKIHSRKIKQILIV